MALTLTRKRGPFSIGNARAVVYIATFDSSYATGGESLTEADIGFSEIYHVSIDPINATAAGLTYNYDYSAKTLMAFYPSGGGAAAPATPAAPTVAGVVPSGAVAVTSSSAQPAITQTVTPGIAKEVGSTANLSTYAVRLWIVGQ